MTLEANRDMPRLLAAIDAAPPVDAADVLAAELAKTVGASEATFLIADFSGGALVRLAHTGNGSRMRVLRRETAQRVPLTGSGYEQALRTQQIVLVDDDSAQIRLLAPVTNRGEAIGILELRLPEPPDEQVVEYVASVAKAFALVVIANRRHTDLFAWGQRSAPLSLAAEIQHRLLPDSFTCEAGQFTLAGWVAPADTIGGDTFDYSLDRDLLHLSLTDAMGHAVSAAMLATLLVGSLRNSRRRGLGLAEQARAANDALLAHAPEAHFVTGQLVLVDLLTGTAQIVNAGHPPPLRLRAGDITPVPLHADPPFGLLAETEYTVQEMTLRAGDRLVFLTDGVLDRNLAVTDAAAVMAAAVDQHPRELVQQVIQAALRATDGRLNDDATVLCLDWYGGPPRDRGLATPDS